MNELDLISLYNSSVSRPQVSKANGGSESRNIFVVGCPRSGTTALMQALSTVGAFAYPTNCMTRFCASMKGALSIQELMFNEDFGLVKQNPVIEFNSDYGRSDGPLNVNEFFHFFRRFFPNKDIEFLDDTMLKKVDVEMLNSELSVIKNFYGKPFVSKGLMLQYNIDYFYSLLPNSLFIYIEREPIYVMQSIYKARIKELGSVEYWWSAKPEEFKKLKSKDVYHQIAGQVFYTNKCIKNKLQLLPPEAKVFVKYEDFVSSPIGVIEEICDKSEVVLQDAKLLELGNNIHDGNRLSLPSSELEKLQVAYRNIEHLNL